MPKEKKKKKGKEVKKKTTKVKNLYKTKIQEEKKNVTPFFFPELVVLPSVPSYCLHTCSCSFTPTPPTLTHAPWRKKTKTSPKRGGGAEKNHKREYEFLC